MRIKGLLSTHTHHIFLRELTTSEWDTEARDNKDLIYKLNRVSTVARLPVQQTYLVLASYLASYLPAQHHGNYFGSVKTKRLRRKDYRLSGPKAFTLERLLAIYLVLVEGEGEVCGETTKQVNPRIRLYQAALNSHTKQIATLCSLRYLLKIPRDGFDGKWKCNVTWDTVRVYSKRLKCDLSAYFE